MSEDILGYSSHDWRKFTDDALVVDDTVDHKALKVNNSRVIFTNPKTSWCKNYSKVRWF